MGLHPLTHTLCAYKPTFNIDSLYTIESAVGSIVGEDFESWIDKLDNIITEMMARGNGSSCNMFTSAIDEFNKTLEGYKINYIPKPIIHLFQTIVAWREDQEKVKNNPYDLDGICEIYEHSFRKQLDQQNKRIQEDLESFQAKEIAIKSLQSLKTMQSPKTISAVSSVSSSSVNYLEVFFGLGCLALRFSGIVQRQWLKHTLLLLGIGAVAKGILGTPTATL